MEFDSVTANVWFSLARVALAPSEQKTAACHSLPMQLDALPNGRRFPGPFSPFYQSCLCNNFLHSWLMNSVAEAGEGTCERTFFFLLRPKVIWITLSTEVRGSFPPGHLKSLAWTRSSAKPSRHSRGGWARTQTARPQRARGRHRSARVAYARSRMRMSSCSSACRVMRCVGSARQSTLNLFWHKACPPSLPSVPCAALGSHSEASSAS